MARNGVPRRIMVVFGTRPEAIKLAPVIARLQESPRFEPIVVVSGQHRHMLDQVLDLFALAPDHDLHVIQSRQSLADVTVRTLERVSPLIDAERPDGVLVQGDTTTAFAGALAAFYHRVPVVHLEAGLRTGDRYAPYPEEINRRLLSELASLHLAPTPDNRAHLLHEGVDPETIVVTGNTVIDALHHASALDGDYGDPALAGLDDDPRRVLLVTAHRRESWGAPLERVAAALAEIAEADDDLLVVFPIHRNPAVRETVMVPLVGLDNVIVTEPLDYGAFARLMRRSDVVLTDSGGLQEEAPSLGKPVLVMREKTERPEAVACGTVRLVGTDPPTIVDSVRMLLEDERLYRQMVSAENPYGDGRAADRSAAAIAWFLSEGARPADFAPAQRPPRTRPYARLSGSA